MHYVYLIRSINTPEHVYFGYTEDVQARLDMHNSGRSLHTTKYKPWKLVAFFACEDKNKALDLEKYLKSQAGRAFAMKRLW